MDKERCIRKGCDGKGFYSLIETSDSEKPQVFRDLGTARRNTDASPFIKDPQGYVQSVKPRKPTTEEIVKQFFIDTPQSSNLQPRNET